MATSDLTLSAVASATPGVIDVTWGVLKTGGSGAVSYTVSGTGLSTITGSTSTSAGGTVSVTVGYGVTGSYTISGTGGTTQYASATAGSPPTYPPSWSDNTLAGFTATVVYSDGVSATNMSYSGSYSVSAGSLPAGISLNSSSGAVTGTPTTVGAYSFTITASNSYGSVSQAFSGSVAAAPTAGKLKVWNGSVWVYGPVKVWNGSAWVTGVVKVWNGTGWTTSV